jgi:hypothetical protein
MQAPAMPVTAISLTIPAIADAWAFQTFSNVVR